MSETKSLKTTNGGRPQLFDTNTDSLEEANISMVPKAILKRVNALKNIQMKILEIEAKFFEELHQLECKYAPSYAPLFELREKIVNGEYEPTEEEGRWRLDECDTEEMAPKENQEDVNSLVADLKSKINISAAEETAAAVLVKGIPDFWLQTFKCSELISDMIQEHDEPVLKHLKDARVLMNSSRPYGYTLEFHFSENEFFSNRVLTKTYELNIDLDLSDPFSYEGPNLVKCTGCAIEWHKGKNVTVRVIKKKQKHKNSGTIRVVNKEIKQDSFFNFFDLNSKLSGVVSSGTEDGKKDENEEEEEEDANLLAADFEIGHFFKENLIPKAILYFSGEILDGDDLYDEEEEDFDEEDDEDDEEDDDEEEMMASSPAKKSVQKVAVVSGGSKSKQSRGAPI